MTKMKIWGKTKVQMVSEGIKTATYQRELLREHRICISTNNSNVSVHFDSDKGKYYVLCGQCEVYDGKGVVE